MIWNCHGRQITLEVYHGVPKGWYAEEILAEHERLGGKCDISGPEATEPGAPYWMPERQAWLQYRETLYRIADGVRENDAACVELAVRYIELRHIGSYSGYIRSKLGRALKHATLTRGQKKRLHVHFRDLLARGERTHEFKEYFKLWRRIMSGEQRKELFRAYETRGETVMKWLPEKLAAEPGAAQGAKKRRS